MNDQAYNQKNSEDYEENTLTLNNALLEIEGNKNLKATVAQLSKMTGIHRNTITNRSWPVQKLKQIKEKRKVEEKSREEKANQNTSDPKNALEDKLNQTRYTQPAILTTSVAIYRLLQEKGFKADMVAGLSLGEYSALVASGALSFEDAVALVAKRGEFMETAAPAGTGKMVAVMNTEASLIEEI